MIINMTYKSLVEIKVVPNLSSRYGGILINFVVLRNFGPRSILQFNCLRICMLLEEHSGLYTWLTLRQEVEEEEKGNQSL